METRTEFAACTSCGRESSTADLVRLDKSLLCGECKMVYVQRLREGAPSPERPHFLFSATDPDGKSVTDKVEAASAGAAQYALELRGFRNITFHEDDISAATRKLFDDQNVKQLKLSGKEALQVQRNSSAGQMVWLNLKRQWFFWGVQAAVIGSQMARGTPASPLALLAYGIVAFQLFVYFLATRPLALYKSLITAVEWGRWAEVKQLVARIRRMGPWMLARVPELELDVRSAQVLAAEGQLEEGLRLLEKYEGDPKVEAWMLCSRRAGVCATGKDYDRAVAEARRALELGPTSASNFIDLAQYLVMRKRDPVEARYHLEQGVQRTSSELAQVFIPWIGGMIALEEQNHANAIALLDEALEKSLPFSNVAYMGAVSRLIKSYKALALAALGDTAGARKLWDEVRDYLVSVDDTMLLDRLEREIEPAR